MGINTDGWEIREDATEESLFEFALFIINIQTDLRLQTRGQFAYMFGCASFAGARLPTFTRAVPSFRGARELGGKPPAVARQKLAKPRRW